MVGHICYVATLDDPSCLGSCIFFPVGSARHLKHVNSLQAQWTYNLISFLPYLVWQFLSKYLNCPECSLAMWTLTEMIQHWHHYWPLRVDLCLHSSESQISTSIDCLTFYLSTAVWQLFLLFHSFKTFSLHESYPLYCFPVLCSPCPILADIAKQNFATYSGPCCLIALDLVQ